MVCSGQSLYMHESHLTPSSALLDIFSISVSLRDTIQSNVWSVRLGSIVHPSFTPRVSNVITIPHLHLIYPYSTLPTPLALLQSLEDAQRVSIDGLHLAATKYGGVGDPLEAGRGNNQRRYSPSTQSFSPSAQTFKLLHLSRQPSFFELFTCQYGIL